MLSNSLQDLRFALRALAKKPGFTLVAVLTLALGIGANTAVFSVVNAVLLRPLPYPQAARMIYVYSGNLADPKFEGALSPPNFTDLHDRNQSFEAYCAFNHPTFTLTADNQPEALNGMAASGDFGRVVGVVPAIGRMFTAEEDVPGKDHVVLISDGLWKRRFGSSQQIIGQSVQLNGEQYTIIGVMPPNFNFPSRSIEVWTPLALDLSKSSRGTSFLASVGRLKANVTIEQARTDLDGIVEQLKAEIPNFGQNVTLRIDSVRDHLFSAIDRPLMILFGAVVLVLLIACVNVANLVLGRATARWKEMALRVALGASRWSLMRLVLIESLVLAIMGGAVGLLFASYGIDALLAISPAIPAQDKISIDGFVIAFTFLTSLAAGVIFGLAPAWQATRTDLNQALRESSLATTGAKRLTLIRSALIVAEISLSLVLLVSAGLLLESLSKLMRVNPGFQAENVATCRIDLPRSRYAQEWQQVEFYRRTLEQTRQIPGVEVAGLGTSLPFSGSRGHSSFSIDGSPISPNDPNGPAADRHQVAPGYFAVMGIPLRAGRDFTDADDIPHPGVVVINEVAAKLYFADEDPIGKRLTIGMGQEVKLYGKPVSREIIGIVGNVKHEALKDEFQPEMYIPAYQVPSPGMTLLVRGHASAESLIGGMRAAVQSIDQDQPVRRTQLLSTAIAGSIAPQRFVTTLLLLFAGLALVLAVVGIYGVMSYSVTQRTREIGIRIALGAQTSDVLKLIVRQGLVLALIGVAIGVGAAVGLTRLMSSLLYGVSATDPLTYATLAILLTGVALGACFVPARRATKVDPMIALRYE